MSDGSGSMSVRGHRPGARGDRSTNRLLERIVRMMAEMEDGRRPATSLDLAATPLAARRIQSVVLTARNERHRRPSGGGNRTTPVLVRTSTSFHPSAGVTEGVVLVRRDRRTRAYCVRLEQQGAHWRIVELAPPDTALLPAVTRASREGRVDGIGAEPIEPGAAEEPAEDPDDGSADRVPA